MSEKSKLARFGRLVGGSRRMRKVYSMIRKGAAVDMPVLIIGETGAGKGLVARELHDRSARKDGPFVAFNTGAVATDLVASELFGHKKGAFTGATEDRLGRLQEANGGSLFLDEIGTMEPRMQVSLLRALEENKIRPLGAKKDVPIDFRLIAATNVSLEEAVREGRFRDDLFYRLRVLGIKLPPLRYRSEDIPMLCDEFIRSINQEFDFSITGMSHEALQLLQEYEWPGNLRELKNVLAQATVLATKGEIRPEHLPAHLGGQVSASDIDLDPPETVAPVATPVETPIPAPLDTGPADDAEPRARSVEDGLFIPIGTTLEEVQRVYTLKTLESCNNNKTQAAKLLNVSRKALYDKLIRWGEDKNVAR